MTIDEAIAIVREEADFCGQLAEKEDGNGMGGDFADFMRRKAEAQRSVLAEIERLRKVEADLRAAIDAGPCDLTTCVQCGKPVVTENDGLPLCSGCGENEAVDDYDEDEAHSDDVWCHDSDMGAH